MSAPIEASARITLAVIGMHRSGTSLLAGSLQDAGVELGEVNEAAKHNRKGNRENIPIRDLNDRILKRHGYDWKTPPPLDALPLEWTEDEKAEGREVLARLPSGPDVVRGFKDPRTIWTLEGWRDLDPSIRMIGVFRAPGAVVASLTKREGALSISPDDALELWRRTNRRLLALIRQDPSPLLHFSEADLETEFFNPLVDALQALGLDSSVPEFFDQALVNNGGAKMKDASAATVYAELLNAMGRSWR